MANAPSESKLSNLLTKVEQNYGLLKSLSKELQPKTHEEDKLTKIIVNLKLSFKVGDKVEIKNTGYIGTIDSFNEKIGGFYPGVLYPFIIAITEVIGEDKFAAIGCKFEYSSEQVSHISESPLKVGT